MNKPFLSIITPTLNRAYILSQCYESLCKQTSKNFEWIIVDDGSQDDTENLAYIWKKKNKINIQYIKQANGGKHRAHNMGVNNSKGELIVCVDSDDALIESAVQRVEEVWKEVKDKAVAGILALRGDFSRKPICSEIPKGINVCTTYDLAHKYNFKGDTMLIYRSEILKKYQFPEFNGEKFIPECSIYYEIDKEFPMYLLNEVLYLCEYLQDGLTQNFHTVLKKNPIGTAYCYYIYFKNSYEMKFKMKYAIITNAYRSLIKNKTILKFSDSHLWMFLTYPLGLVYRVVRLNKIKI